MLFRLVCVCVQHRGYLWSIDVGIDIRGCDGTQGAMDLDGKQGHILMELSFFSTVNLGANHGSISISDFVTNRN